MKNISNYKMKKLKNDRYLNKANSILLSIPARHTTCSRRGLVPFTECIMGTADILFCRILEATPAKDSSGPACREQNRGLGSCYITALPHEKLNREREHLHELKAFSEMEQ